MTASLPAKFTYLLFLSLATANQTLERLRKGLHEAFLPWIPIRRDTKETLEHLARNLSLENPASIMTGTVIGTVIGAVVGAALGAPLAGAVIGAMIGAGKSHLSAEEEETLRLAEVQVAIEKDRTACAELQGQLNSLKRTFTSYFMVRNVANALTRASRFADSSILPSDITQLVKSSLDRHHRSTSPIVQEIRGILNNLKCPDETEIQRLV